MEKILKNMIAQEGVLGLIYFTLLVMSTMADSFEEYAILAVVGIGFIVARGALKKKEREE